MLLIYTFSTKRCHLVLLTIIQLIVLQFSALCWSALKPTIQSECQVILSGGLERHENVDPPVIDFDLSQVQVMDVSDIGQEAHFVTHSMMDAEWRLQEIEKIISFANKQFERREWSKEFLEERLRIAKKYASQSSYLYTQDAFLYSKGITGSIGLTSAEYSAENLSSEIVTMEETHGWKLKRPLSSNGKGKIIEMRTYGMDPEAKKEPYRILWTGVHRMIRDELKLYPDLWDKDVIFTYGDEISIRMYRPMGFELADEKLYPPVTHDGTTWKVLVSSPKKMLENFLSKVDYKVWIGGFKNPVAFYTTATEKFVADFNRPIYMYGVKNPMSFTLYYNDEVAPGINVYAGSKIGFFPSGKVRAVQQVEGETEVLPGIFAKDGSAVRFYENGKIHRVMNVARDYTVTKGSGIQLAQNPDIRFTESQMNIPTLDVVKKGSRLIFDENGNISTYLGPDYKDQGLFEYVYARDEKDAAKNSVKP